VSDLRPLPDPPPLSAARAAHERSAAAAAALADAPTGVAKPRQAWPERIDAQAAALLTDSQWIGYLDRQPYERVEEWQRRRLARLISHATQQSAWWRERLRHLDAERAFSLTDLPVTGREDYRSSVDTAGGPLPTPDSHGAPAKGSTSGSSGTPVVFYTSNLSRRLITAEWYYDDIRQGRDPALPGAELSGGRIPEHAGEHRLVKGNPVFGTRDWMMRRLQQFTMEEHARWLSDAKPAYLSVSAHLLAGMLDVYESGAVPAPPVKQVLTYAETVDADIRKRAHALLGASIRDRYSCFEIGPIAFQCPRSDEHYHLASSNVVVEILDDGGQPCAPGVIGRVVVTGLHTFPSPAIRYELNDLAAWLPACACGRRAPVLARLLGRKRFLIRLPSGDRTLPRIAARHWLAIAPVREYRLVQVSETVLHAEIVLDRPATDEERQAFVAMLQQEISPELTYEIHQLERIAWGPTYKRQDVISLI
jgi:phenylacetate-CoA ligase